MTMATTVVTNGGRGSGADASRLTGADVIITGLPPKIAQ
jgi:hypothetical protein